MNIRQTLYSVTLPSPLPITTTHVLNTAKGQKDGNNHLERGEQRVEFLNFGRFTHRQHVAGKLEMLHVLEITSFKFFNFHDRNVLDDE